MQSSNPTGKKRARALTNSLCNVFSRKKEKANRYHAPSLMENLESRVLLSAFVVTKLGDDGGMGELRAAIQQANAAGGTNTISFQSGLTGTITLAKGQLELSAGNITISGPGAGLLTVNANKASRVFLVDSRVTGNISGLTITGGYSYDINNIGNTPGGGIENLGNLTMTNCIVSGNAVGGPNNGGGIFNDGTLTVTGCTISGNLANFSIGGFGGDGGGIFNSNGTLMVTNSTIDSNSASTAGGGIYSDGTLTVTGCTISGNFASSIGGGYGGGGIWNDGTLTLTNSTVSRNGTYSSFGGGGIYSKGTITATNGTIYGNEATGIGCEGGGILSQGTLTLTNCTISNNSADSGGTPYTYESGGGIAAYGTLTIKNCVISDNSVSGTGASGGGISIGGKGTLTGSTIEGNNANTSGGIENGGTLTVTNCTISGNSANAGGVNYFYSGGGIGNYGTLTLTSSTISGNSLNTKFPGGFLPSYFDGGGIYNHGKLTVVSSIISGNAVVTSGPGGSKAYCDGGGIFSDGTLTVTSSTISGNMVNAAGADYDSAGGGIYNKGTLTVTGSTFTKNNDSGIANDDAGVLNITSSTFSGNSGSGIRNEDAKGVVTVSNSTISGNSASGIFTYEGNLTVINCTISGNSTSLSGGGICVYGGPNPTTDILTVRDSTISGNDANLFGGGIYIYNAVGKYDATIFNTIVAGNTYSPGGSPGGEWDIAGTLDSNLASGQAHSSNNLIGTFGNGGLTNGVNGNIVGVSNAKLGAPANNGGPTETMALLAGSPAINKGNNTYAVDASGRPLTTDQRGTGYARIVNGTVDIGAYEVQATSTAVAKKVVFVTQPTNAIAGKNINPAIVVDVEDAGGNVVKGNTSLVALAVRTGPGAIMGTYFVNAVNGVATFNDVYFQKAGGYQLYAVDGPLNPAISSVFRIAPAAVTQLKFVVSPPATATAGDKLSPIVTVLALDAFGNAVSGVTITMTVASGPGSLSGNAISTTSPSGIASFGNLILNKAGTYTLRATAGSVKSGASSSVTVAA